MQVTDKTRKRIVQYSESSEEYAVHPVPLTFTVALGICARVLASKVSCILSVTLFCTFILDSEFEFV